MNPTFMAMQKAVFTASINMMMGIKYEPKKQKETSINGRAFAPGKGVQQEVSSEEKEATVRAHLDKLAGEAKARYLDECSKYPTIEEHSYPCSDLITLRDEEMAERNTEAEAHVPFTDRIAFNTKADAKVMTALYGSDNGVKIDEVSTHEQVLNELHKTHAAYIERRIALNREEAAEKAIPIPFPVSDLITLRDEEQERRERAANAGIHTGDGRFEAQ